jgi:hypothetical protein
MDHVDGLLEDLQAISYAGLSDDDVLELLRAWEALKVALANVEERVRAELAAQRRVYREIAALFGQNAARSG